MKTTNTLTSLGLLLTLGACANMSALQTGETLPEGQSETAIGFGYVNHKAIVSQDSESEASAPYMELQYRRGFLKNFDAGLKVTLIGTGGIDGKYQFYDGEKLDMAAGAALAYLSIESGNSKSTIIDLSVPLYISSPVSEKVSLYTSPKYMLRTSTGNSDSLHIIGATAGVKWGKDSGIMVESSYGMALGDSSFKSLQYNAAFFLKGDFLF